MNKREYAWFVVKAVAVASGCGALAVLFMIGLFELLLWLPL